MEQRGPSLGPIKKSPRSQTFRTAQASRRLKTGAADFWPCSHRVSEPPLALLLLLFWRPALILKDLIGFVSKTKFLRPLFLPPVISSWLDPRVYQTGGMQQYVKQLTKDSAPSAKETDSISVMEASPRPEFVKA